MRRRKEPKGQESSSDGMDKLTQLIKQMEINQANQSNKWKLIMPIILVNECHAKSIDSHGKKPSQ
jgi:hypothetical protein